MNDYDLTVLNSALSELDLTADDQQLGQLMQYYELLVEWNSFMNLTAITDFQEVCIKHFADSLSLVRAIDCMAPMHVIDVGTGAGFPGIPLKIFFPNMTLVLLDSLEKRVKFLSEVIAQLGLHNIEVIHGRAEDYARDASMREQFDLCVSRAVAKLSTLSEYCLPYVRVGGHFVAYKSEKAAEEGREAQHAISLLGGREASRVELTLPRSDMYRCLVVINKVAVTPKKYPRKAGLPAKEPIV